MPELVARHFLTGKPTRVRWEGAQIVGVDELSPAPADLPSDVFLCPGMVDVQINGFGGINFGDPNLTIDKAREVCQKLQATGMTHFLPTLITDSVERMGQALRRLHEASLEADLRPSMIGFHLEGPYLSSVDGPRGAHPLEHCKNPDWEEFQRLQECAGGKVRLVTLAPEREGAIGFIEKAVASGVRIAIGHTAANRQQILDAISAGASLATHLGNAAHDQIQRHHNYIFDQLADDRLMASLIVDGHHLPPHLVKIFLRVKGIERIILTSDAVQWAGMPPGIYDGGYRKFEVREDGYVGVYGEPRMAGSGMLLIRGVENLVRFTEASFADAIRAATEIPAVYLGLDHQIGRLQPGHESTFLLLRWQPDIYRATILQTVINGQAPVISDQ